MAVKAVTLCEPEAPKAGPDYEHIPACLWPPSGCLVELDPLWHLTGRRIVLDNGCCITHDRPLRRNGWKVYHITVDAGTLPDPKMLVDNVHQWSAYWENPDFAPCLAPGEKPNEFNLLVW